MKIYLNEKVVPENEALVPVTDRGFRIRNTAPGPDVFAPGRGTLDDSAGRADLSFGQAARSVAGGEGRQQKDPDELAKRQTHVQNRSMDV